MASKNQSHITVDSGSDGLQSCPLKKQSSTDNIKTLLILCSCFFVFVFRSYSTSIRSSATSADALLGQISKLTHDMDAFEELKKKYVDDELELSWDRQHVYELEANIKSMKMSFNQLTHQFNDEEKALKERNDKVREALKESSIMNSNALKLDNEVISTLSKELTKTESELAKEHTENLELKRLIEVKSQQLRQLRGAPAQTVN